MISSDIEHAEYSCRRKVFPYEEGTESGILHTFTSDHAIRRKVFPYEEGTERYIKACHCRQFGELSQSFSL